jgi:hypothetical protein
MSAYNLVKTKLEEFNTIKKNMEYIFCDCFAVYEISVHDDRNQFNYVIDYETEKEAMGYVERVYNLVADRPNVLAVIPVKKNACGEIFNHSTTNIINTFIIYNGICKMVLMNSRNPFMWIDVHCLEAGYETLAAKAKTASPQPENWITCDNYDVYNLVVKWNKT